MPFCAFCCHMARGLFFANLFVCGFQEYYQITMIQETTLQSFLHFWWQNYVLLARIRLQGFDSISPLVQGITHP